jgi:hypothetical protein
MHRAAPGLAGGPTPPPDQPVSDEVAEPSEPGVASRHEITFGLRTGLWFVPLVIRPLFLCQPPVLTDRRGLVLDQDQDLRGIEPGILGLAHDAAEGFGEVVCGAVLRCGGLPLGADCRWRMTNWPPKPIVSHLLDRD